uniref:lytic cellulose monooxygenase (C4-dehydrogenating) n=1 Tax=Rhizophlyctis rosea TaxID=64517 RepID=A0A2U8U9W3_9FUNG|nr:lytic polysaccharide monooxygenase 9 [Rhizophlyctis rosea]
MYKTAAIALGLLAGANAHYYIKNIDGQTTCLRSLVLYGENLPISGSQVDSDVIKCGAALPGPAAGTCSYAAGSTVTVQYDTKLSNHPGPCAAYIAKSGTNQWAKIAENTWSTANGGDGWCSYAVSANDNKWSFKLPAGLASGSYVLRVEHLGLHQASQPNGAQFYVRCMDINVTGGGSSVGSPLVSFPGAYSSTTVGVVWDPYRGDANNANYPGIGGPVASFGSGGSNPNPQPTTTTTSQQQPPRTTTTTTTQQQPPRTTTTTVSTGGGPCANLYGQCGGQGWSGPTCCSAGTCKASNQWYSQCLN